jgi:phosphatidylglycerophosphatase A
MPDIPQTQQDETTHFTVTPRWALGSLHRIVAFGLGSGLIRPAPGTWGTLLGWLLWVAVLEGLPDLYIGLIILVAFGLGCWACGKTGREIGVPDHGGMVWDEIVAFWLVLWTPSSLAAQATAFVVFRGFDIIKPPPIRYFDARFKSGFGVMWDDILAAAYSLLLMAVLVRFGVFA